MLVDWVKNGGALIYCGEDIDPYQQVPEWWNKSPYAYHSPSEHLFELAGLDRKPAAGKYTVGKEKYRLYAAIRNTLHWNRMVTKCLKSVYILFIRR